jgi:hypothetical protein
MNVDLMEEEEEGEIPHGKITKTFDGIIFNSNFDSGNLARVESVHSKVPNVVEFHLWTAPDCSGTQYQNGNRSWFYFTVTTPSTYNGNTIKLSIQNLNKQGRLYQQGLTPLTRTVPGKMTWERMRDRPEYQSTENGMVLSFQFSPPEYRKTITYFAFCYPFSYADCLKYLTRIEQRLPRRVTTPDDNNHHDITEIYYRRDVLCYSLDGLRIDLITVSSYDGITSETEPLLPGLFPESDSSRSNLFEGKKVVLITSRVHPGETPASFVFNGFLEFLLRPDDPRSQALRRNFVFKMVPMINPDGVQRGHYRTDSRGINLNRVYGNPNQSLHPSVFAIRQLMLYYHARDTSPDATSSDTSFTGLNDDVGGVAAYIDLHAHATKRGCFMYGNHFHNCEDHAQSMLLPKLVSLNSAHFDFDHCVFSEKNMYIADKRDGTITKEGCGRVALYKATNLIYCYTLECNYNSGMRVNPITPAANNESGKCTPCGDGSNIPHKLITQDFEEVGRGLSIAILDLFDMNPCSRLPSSEYISLARLKQHLQHKVLQDRKRIEMKKQDNKRHNQQQQMKSDVSIDLINEDQANVDNTVTMTSNEPNTLLAIKQVVVSSSDSIIPIADRKVPVSFRRVKSGVHLPLVTLNHSLASPDSNCFASPLLIKGHTIEKNTTAKLADIHQTHSTAQLGRLTINNKQPQMILSKATGGHVIGPYWETHPKWSVGKSLSYRVKRKIVTRTSESSPSRHLSHRRITSTFPVSAKNYLKIDTRVHTDKSPKTRANYNYL